MKKPCLFLFLIFFLFCQNIYGSEYPRVKFKRYETAHQVLYFSSNLDDSAISRLIKEAKTSEEFIRNLYGWVPDKKIITVYDRETDTANGWSRSYLKNTIMLYMFPPDRYSTLSSFTSWEQGLHVHEYTHSTQIGMTKGFPKFVNTIFGNLYFPGGMIPLWMIEGVAIYSESLIGGKGRLNSPLYRAYFDSYFLKGNQFNLGQLSGVPDHWMGGRILYLYGTFFYDYLMETFSPEELSQMFIEMSDDIFPIAIAGTAMKSALKQYPATLYDDFINKNLQRVIEERKDSSGINGSSERYHSVAVDLNSEGYIFSGSGTGKNGVYRFENKKSEKIVSIPGHNNFSFKEDSILFPNNVTVKDRYSRSELFLTDIKKRSVERITRNESVLEAVFGRDNDVFYISFRDGINRITQTNSDGTVIKERSFPMLNSIYSMSLSKDGKKMAFTGNRHHHGKNIFILDLVSDELTEINIEGEQYSVYFQDDNELVFSSGREGFIVPMHLNIETGKLTRLYRPKLIAIYPKIIGEDIFFIAFDNDGYFPAWHPIENIDEGIIEKSQFVKVVNEEIAEKPEYELTSGKFYEGLFPSIIIPDYRGSSNTHTVGFNIEGESNDLQRFYTLHLSKTFGSIDRWYTSVNYFDKSILPGFRWYFTYSRENFPTVEFSEIKRKSDRFNTGFSLSGSFNGFFYILPSKLLKSSNSIRTSIGIGVVDEHLSGSKDPLFLTPEEKGRITLNTSFSYSTSFSFNPGSYYLFSDMERFALNLPVLIQQSLVDQQRYITFSPSTKLSFLILNNGKLGFVTKHSLYARFLSDSYFSLGGHELDTQMLDIKAILVGGVGSTITVRGYNYGALTGKHVYYTNNELRFHILSINKGFGTVPIMFKNLQGALFFDMGTASNDINLFNKQFIAGAGGELKLFIYFIYRVPLVLTFGMAKGLTTKGELNWYFNFGNSF